jgi:hypothetical protein
MERHGFGQADGPVGRLVGDGHRDQLAAPFLDMGVLLKNQVDSLCKYQSSSAAPPCTTELERGMSLPIG